MMLVAIAALACSMSTEAAERKPQAKTPATRMQVKTDVSIRMAGPDVWICDKNNCMPDKMLTVVEKQDGCEVQNPYLVIVVPQGYKTKIKWRLDNSAKKDYQFDKTKGVEMDPLNDP